LSSSALILCFISSIELESALSHCLFTGFTYPINITAVRSATKISTATACENIASEVEILLRFDSPAAS
jgi:hypothetical protein